MPNNLTKSDILTIRRKPLINSAIGIIPTASVWNTNPTNLAACTDDNPETATGFGSTIMGAIGNFGRLDFILPEAGIYLVFCKLGYYSTAGQISLRFQSKADGINFTWSGLNILFRTVTSEEIITTQPKAVIGTEFQLYFQASAAGTYFTRIHEVYAYRIG